MSQDERAPHIRLEIDQEVFIDTVSESDVIEDATVATEVTSFDRVGDAYVLEGAVVFAGYLKNNESDKPGTGTYEPNHDILDFGADEDFVRHVHHRMPFVLRVPQHAQPRGIVNVASRIASWELKVVGTGWIQVVADLTVVGLVGQEGYHFQCGSQEDGDLFFGAKSDATTASVSAEYIPHSVNAELEAVSFARGGHEGDGHHDQSTGSADTEVLSSLAAFDRALEGNTRGTSGEDSDAETEPSSFAQVPHEGDVTKGPESAYGSDAEGGADVFNADSPQTSQGTDGQPFAEFEFVHQVPVSEFKQPMSSGDYRTNETFVASRSFSEEGFKPGEGFVSNEVQVAFSGAGVEDRAFDDAEFASENEFDADEQGFHHDENADVSDESFGAEIKIRSESTTDDTSKLWSFVDFHAPEKFYTMRFIVVMDEETLESVSERVGCPRSEIARVNRLDGDGLHAGQTLLVPNYKMNWSR